MDSSRSHHGNVQELVEKDLTVVKVGDLLARRASWCPNARCTATALSDRHGHQKDTVLLADPDPGRELQADFGRMGLLFAPVRPVAVRLRAHTGRGSSRHMFVCLTFTQTTADVIEGMERAGPFSAAFSLSLSPTTSYLSSPSRADRSRINDFLGVLPREGFPDRRRTRATPPGQSPLRKTVPFIRSGFSPEKTSWTWPTWPTAGPVAWCFGGGRHASHGTTQCRPPRLSGLPAPLCCPPRPPLTTHRRRPAQVHPLGESPRCSRAIYSIPGDDMVVQVRLGPRRLGGGEVLFQGAPVPPARALEGALPTPPTCPASGPLTPCVISSCWWWLGGSRASRRRFL